VATSPIARLVAWAREREWTSPSISLDRRQQLRRRLFRRLIEGAGGDPQTARGKDGQDWDETMFSVFRLDNGTIRHFLGSDLTWAPTEPGQHHRSGDAVNALWGLLDMTPEGRGQFMPKLVYCGRPSDPEPSRICGRRAPLPGPDALQLSTAAQLQL
jgi:predicted dithiol-disulfide oxidoreductase (DUF899 family)